MTENAPATELAGRGHRALDALHSLSYFAPESEQKLTEAGLRPGRMCYFASRAAAMGAVGPGGVTATFYNFNPSLIQRHIPRAWTLADPAEILTARLAGVDPALRRRLGAPGAGSAGRGRGGRAGGGGPLSPPQAEFPRPPEPHLRLWHAVTLLREHRGDGHLATLVRHDLNGIDALVTHTATGRGFLPDSARMLRGWSE